MGLIENIKNWFEKRAERKRQERELKRAHELEKARIKAETLRIKMEAQERQNLEKIKSAELRKIKEIEAKTEKARLKASAPPRPSLLEKLTDYLNKRGERKKAKHAAQIDLEIAREKEETEKERIKASTPHKPSFWERFFKLFEKPTPVIITPPPGQPATTPQTRVTAKRSNLLRNFRYFIYILIGFIIWRYYNQNETTESAATTSVNFAENFFAPDTIIGKINLMKNIPEKMPEEANLRLLPTTGKIFSLSTDQPVKIGFIDQNGNQKSIDWHPNTSGYNHWPKGTKKFFVYGNSKAEIQIVYQRRNS